MRDSAKNSTVAAAVQPIGSFGRVEAESMPSADNRPETRHERRNQRRPNGREVSAMTYFKEIRAKRRGRQVLPSACYWARRLRWGARYRALLGRYRRQRKRGQ